MKKIDEKKRILVAVIIFSVLILGSLGISSVSSDDSPRMVSFEPYDYHTYQEMTELLQNLALNHSDIMSLSSIGRTYQGRDIWMVKLSDNVTQEEEEPGVLFMGAHHGNEKPSFEVCIYFIEYMIENYGNSSLGEVREVFDNTQIYVVPMVNPDGVEAETRKNAAPNHGPFGKSKEITSYGVNLNRNYDDLWFLYYILPVQYGLFFTMEDSSFNYRGPRPFSENETQAIKEFADSHNISASISYHTYGEIIFFPWMHSTQPTRDEALYLSIGENISEMNHYYLYAGETHLIPRFGGTLGSSENWLYREHGIIAFLIELGTQHVPTNSETIQNLCQTHSRINLYMCQRALTIESEKQRAHL